MMDDIERASHYGTSPSLRSRDYKPLAGLADPNPWVDGKWDDWDNCPTCNITGVYWKLCNGGTFTCWDSVRYSSEVHVDKMCEYDHINTDWIPR